MKLFTSVAEFFFCRYFLKGYCDICDYPLNFSLTCWTIHGFLSWKLFWSNIRCTTAFYLTNWKLIIHSVVSIENELWVEWLHIRVEREGEKIYILEDKLFISDLELTPSFEWGKANFGLIADSANWFHTSRASWGPNLYHDPLCLKYSQGGGSHLPGITKHTINSFERGSCVRLRLHCSLLKRVKICTLWGSANIAFWKSLVNDAASFALLVCLKLKGNLVLMQYI